MKNRRLSFVLPCLWLGFFLFDTNQEDAVSVTDTDIQSVSDIKNNVAGCSPQNLETPDTTANGKFIRPLPGWGNYSYSISSSNDSTRYYFNQGLNMYYSYHMKEALASFKEAARFDSSCSIAYWGQALAMGPYYNYAHGYTAPKTIPTVLQRMNQYVSLANDKEKKLIAAMNKRYATDSTDTSSRTQLNTAYATQLRELIGLFPEDHDIKAWYIDAVMLLHAWDFWNNDGSPKAWTPEVVGLCEEILKKAPRHPAALHYYIHLTEASRHPEVALAGADLLKDLLPGVAHMVHMSSHEYERNGLYAKGVDVNNAADANLVNYESISPHLSLASHASHYFAVQSYCALSGGMYKDGIRYALRCRNSVAPSHDNTYDQYLYMMPALALVRLGKWEEILQRSIEPDSSLTYSRILYDFAHGMALVHTGNTGLAKWHLSRLHHQMADSLLTIRRIPFNTPLQGATIAAHFLEAAILLSEKKYDNAIKHLHQAIAIEDAMVYTEPKDWMIPARQYLGAWLLQLKKPALAEKVYREDLVWNPGNGWSLLGMYQSLAAQRKNKQLKDYQSKYMQSFSHADHIPPASFYIGQPGN